MAVSDLTVDELKDALVYEPETGIFRWRTGKFRNTKINGIAGYQRQGYIAICIRRRYFYAHRLAWLYTHGEWPKNEIDHIDGDKKNNRLCNLRDVTSSENKQNIKGARSDSKLGVIGVRRRKGRFVAAICVAGKQIFIGSFHSQQDASAAYIKAKRIMHNCNTL